MKTTVKERLKFFIKSQKIGQSAFEKTVGLSNGYVNNIRQSIQPDKLQKIALFYPGLNTGWLMTGEGEMLKGNEKYKSDKKKLIPVYDAASIGGTQEVSNMEGVAAVSEYIDAGDWFFEATAAIHHYGDSMIEYPNGCILAVKEVLDRQLIVPGKNYVIETSEFRVTKRLQRGKTPEYIRAYSSNEETYQDGSLIHEPIDIPLEKIRKLAIVLGYVVKQHSSGMVYNVRKP